MELFMQFSPAWCYVIIVRPTEHCCNWKNTAFQEGGKTTGLSDAIASKEQRHFSSLAAILENRRLTLFR
jgi:hypothetical protein